MKKASRYIGLLVLEIIFLSVLHVNVGQAQGENNIWAFGDQAGIDFSSGNAVPIQTSIRQLEGCATVCNAAGDLLFYSDGDTIYNRSHLPMPNGRGIAAYNRTYTNAPTTTYSTTQACVIIPHPGKVNVYYVFSLDAAENLQGRLYYSVVDMNLAGGFGDVIPGQKAMPLDTNLHEKMTAVAGCNNNIWLIVHNELDGYYLRNHYKSYEITTSGLDTVPVISKISTSYGYKDPNNIDFGAWNHYVYLVGSIKFSHDRTKMAAALFPWLTMEPTVIELYDFDACTGIISNPVVLDVDTFNIKMDTSFNPILVGKRYYGVHFSPDDSKLYASCTFSGVYQWDLDQPLASVRNTKTLVYDRPATSSHYLGDLQGGPDGQVYIACNNDSFLHVIRNPNALGTACNFVEHGLSLFPGTKSTYGLPNNTVVPYNRMDTVSFSVRDTVICEKVVLSGKGFSCRYTWSTGALTESITIDRGGIYWVASQQTCSIYIDTFKVTFINGDFNLGADTTICPGDSLVLTVSGDSFQWQDGAIDSFYVVHEAGDYFVNVNESGCAASDTIAIDFYDASADILEKDTVVCKGEQIYLHGISIPAGTFNWNTGIKDDSIAVNISGQYILEVENVCGFFSDTVMVMVQDCDCQPGMPNAFSPNGDGHNDFFKPVFNCYTSGYGLSVYNRYGQRIFSSLEQERGWDGIFNGKPSDSGIYFYYLQYDTPNGKTIFRRGDLVLIR